MPLCPHTRGTAPIPSQPPGRPARSPGGAGPHLAQEGLPAAAAGGADLVGRHHPPPAAPGVQEVLHVPHGRAGAPGHRGTAARPSRSSPRQLRTEAPARGRTAAGRDQAGPARSRRPQRPPSGPCPSRRLLGVLLDRARCSGRQGVKLKQSLFRSVLGLSERPLWR